MNSWLSRIRRRLIAFAVWMAARTVSIMFSFVRQTWLPLRQNVARTLQVLKELGLPTWRYALLRLPLAVVFVVVFVVLAMVALLLIRTEPIGALAMPVDSVAFLGALLGAQAAIAALTLAVTLFVMQAVSTRRDVDDRVYAEYVRRSWVRPIFWGSVGAVAVTGVILTTETLVGDTGTIARGVPGVPNLALVAVFALAVNLTAAIALFEKAIRLTQPERWRNLRSDVNKRDVREAVCAFFGRAERAAAAQAANEIDWSAFLPDRGEGSANQAIRALLDDARRAMDERRHGELERSLNSIEELVEYAMDEIEGAGMLWGPPGSSAEWPPLWELGRNLYSFREEAIRAGNREYIDELLNLDYWLVSTGLRRSCGELFTAGLNGYRWNYQITTRLGGGEFHGMMRDRFLENLDFLTFGHEPERLFPFMQEVVRHQGNVLSDALHANRVDDYRWLHDEFSSILSDILQRWNRGIPRSGRETGPSALLAQEYRIKLMGLAGRAAILADSGELSDATPYLDVARATYARSAVLSDDVSAALHHALNPGFFQWEEWEVPEHLSGWSGSVSPDRYPLTCFAMLLMELTEDATLTLSLRGNARYILDWFLTHSERLERFVRVTPSANAGQRREFSTEVLRNAVLLDELEADREIINRELSTERVGAFESDVYAGMISSGSVVRLFEQAGAFVRLDSDEADLPEERVIRQLLPKAFFVDSAESDQTYYEPVSRENLGLGLSRGSVHLLIAELEAVPLETAPLDTMDAILRAIDAAVDDLDPQGNVAVVLAGDWQDVMFDPRAEEAEGYDPYWRLTEGDPLVDIGRHHGHPILRGPTTGELRVYVVDPGTWGNFVCAPFEEGQDVRVDVEPVSAGRAQELLRARPDYYYSDQPNEESKMRKMQTRVEVIIGVRHGFRVIDPTRARRITPNQPLAEVDA